MLMLPFCYKIITKLFPARKITFLLVLRRVASLFARLTNVMEVDEPRAQYRPIVCSVLNDINRYPLFPL